MAITHARDEKETREIGERHAHWILTGTEPPEQFTAEMKATAGAIIERCKRK